ncbi:MAG: D-alanyl-D-alanine carboxypeptidase family protein [Clostridiales bacterium]|nr:D-alanyl-D-alanine carboxypeptidase family protein [Clostridiales bacterium]
MAGVLEQLLSLAAAGTMLISSSLTTAAPHNDVDGLLFLQNRQWRVSRYFEPETLKASVPGQLQDMRADAAKALEEMFAACKADIGVTLKAVSGYRSYQRQATIYQNKLERVGSKAKADEYVARPGASEHQLGLAMDVGQKSDDVNLTSSFGKTKGGKWVKEHCWEYGFILRYQEGWEDVTGYAYEPWHVRYVGKENAKLIHEADMPLETYLLLLREERLMEIVLGQEEKAE